MFQMACYKKNRQISHDGFPPVTISALLTNALDLTVPASDALLKNRKNQWVQLAGHQGSFAPAGPNTIWKKRLMKDNNETKAYMAMMEDAISPYVPRYYREVEYNGEYFIEMEDLLRHFTDPSIMDIKMGSRTFLESEVKNPVLRKDLYEKMVKLDASEPTEEENSQSSVTKLRYMQFREKGSSTSTLGFRLEAIKMSGETPNTDLKKVKSKEQVLQKIEEFLIGRGDVKEAVMNRLLDLRNGFTASKFFKDHEIIGSSLLVIYDATGKAGVWMIDFAKCFQVEGRKLTHQHPWLLGNHEDGYLTGLNNLIKVIGECSSSESMEVQNSITSQASSSFSSVSSSSISIATTSKIDNNMKHLHQQTKSTKKQFFHQLFKS
ncbi:unnamed protein product [Owenia fusiformis]|uniref:Kinase n=1 Tax=Owenia fusiformis TaxID=6347 RepID=A0A8J1UXR7_OWEFU|nr:unnamed protein product [Owenia fusiformis]